MVSIKKMVDCLEYFPSVPPHMSIMRDFFFYRLGRPLQKLSLLRQVQLLRGKHFHINIIKVGSRETELETKVEHENIATAIQQARQIYAQVDIGIARVLYYHIDSDRANGHEIIDNDAEAKSLTSEWAVRNNGIDVFFVLEYVGNPVGVTDTPGPCDKHDACIMTGAVVSLEDHSYLGLLRPGGYGFYPGLVLAHELGHYLGLDHAQDLAILSECWRLLERPATDAECVDHQPPEYWRRLMFPVACQDAKNILLTEGEGNIMKGHCSIKGGC